MQLHTGEFSRSNAEAVDWFMTPRFILVASVHSYAHSTIFQVTYPLSHVAAHWHTELVDQYPRLGLFSFKHLTCT